MTQKIYSGCLCTLVSSSTNTDQQGKVFGGHLGRTYSFFPQRSILLQETRAFQVDRFLAITINPLGMRSNGSSRRTG